MAHVFDYMCSVVGQLNNIYKKYTGENKSLSSEVPQVPLFVSIAINRCYEKNKELFKEDTKEISCDIKVKANNGDPFTPIYIITCDSAIDVIIDRMPVIINKNDISGPGIGTLIIVPRDIFFTEDISEVIRILISLYSQILGLDPNMQYDASGEFYQILKHSENPKVMIPTYDIEMVHAALCCMYINLRSWWSGDGLIDYITKELMDCGVPGSVTYHLEEMLQEFGISISQLRDGIADGRLVAKGLGYDI